MTGSTGPSPASPNKPNAPNAPTGPSPASPNKPNAPSAPTGPSPASPNKPNAPNAPTGPSNAPVASKAAVAPNASAADAAESTAAAPLISLANVTKDYPLGKTIIHALRGIDLTLHAGEFAAVAGPSGCGKTTLLNIIGCIDHPTDGTVHLDGQEVQELDDAEEAALRLRRIGFVFQNFNLIPVLTVEENVSFPAVLAGTPKSERTDYVAYLLDAVGISEYAHHRPDELSGGQRQRVAVARALVNRPSLVIADEPTANLDSETGDRILDLMRTLNTRDNVTFLFSTHNPEILKFATRTIRLRDGLVEHRSGPQRSAETGAAAAGVPKGDEAPRGQGDDGTVRRSDHGADGSDHGDDPPASSTDDGSTDGAAATDDAGPGGSS